MDQRDIVIRTVIGEAANEGPEGWAAVVNVLRNRTQDSRWPDQIGVVALQPQQFSAWNEGAGGNDLVRKHNPGDPLYERVGAVVDQVMAGGQDNTGGATHYYSPAGMQALVSEGSQSNLLPRWLQEENNRRGGNTTTIGGHIFTGLAEGSDMPVSMAGSVQGAPIATPLAAAGFTQEDIARAFEVAEQQETPQMVLPEAAPAPLPPQAQANPYQNNSDPLMVAMEALQGHKQKRKGLLTWL